MSSIQSDPTEPRSRPLRSQPPLWIRLGSLPADSREDLRFVQDRLALFGKTIFLIAVMFLVVTSGVDMIRDGGGRISAIGRISHVAGTLIALGIWCIGRSRRKLSAPALQALDMGGTLGVCVAFVVMGHNFQQPYGFYTGLLAVVHVNISRAVVVPSVPGRTLVIGILSFLGFVVSRGTLPLPLELPQTLATRIRGILEALLWSTAGSAVSSVASKVIYGLQEKAREALQLGQYTLIEKIGEGGMGQIYRARHAMLRRPTAIKLLIGDGSEEQLRRFEKEVQLTARLTHPNTISIYDYGRTPDGTFYYAMELLEGLTLEQLIERHGPQPAGRVIHILLQICGALIEAHGIGLIHRDIKPANLYFCRRGEVPDFVKVLDFGLVRELRSAGSATGSNINAIVGTPLYLAPEAIVSPAGIDARADIYALGCVAYFLVAGTTPFQGSSIVELCGHHLHSEPEPPSLRQPLAPDVERVILACLVKDPEKRPQSARALAQLLRACEDAGKWSEVDADAWWQKTQTLGQHSASKAAQSGLQLRQTVWCGDLEERLESEQGPA